MKTVSFAVPSNLLPIIYRKLIPLLTGAFILNSLAAQEDLETVDLGGASLQEESVRLDGGGEPIGNQDATLGQAIEHLAQPTLGDGHSHGVGGSLPKRAGGRFDSGD